MTAAEARAWLGYAGRRALVLAGVLLWPLWYLSPLGYGFTQLSPMAGNIYKISWFAGLPLFLTGQIAALILSLTGRRRLAGRVSLWTAVIFLILVALVIIVQKLS